MDQDENNGGRDLQYEVSCNQPYCSNYNPPGSGMVCSENNKDVEKGKLINERRFQDEVVETLHHRNVDRGVSFLSFISRGSMSPGNCSKSSSGIFCRICHDGEGFEKLISPCQCSGSVALVHRSCIEKWLSTANHDTCELCHFKYNISRHPRPFLNWLCEPSVQDDQRNLVGDIICFFLLTPLAGISTYLCATGAAFYLEEKKSESIGLICLCVILVLIYIAWVLLTIKYHVQVWFVWREANQEIRLVETGRQPVSRTHWRNPYQEINCETVAEESTMPSAEPSKETPSRLKVATPPRTPCLHKSDPEHFQNKLDMTTSSFYLAAEKDYLESAAEHLVKDGSKYQNLHLKHHLSTGNITSTPVLFPPSPAPLKSLAVIRSVVSTSNLAPINLLGSYSKLDDLPNRSMKHRSLSFLGVSRSKSMENLSCIVTPSKHQSQKMEDRSTKEFRNRITSEAANLDQQSIQIPSISCSLYPNRGTNDDYVDMETPSLHQNAACNITESGSCLVSDSDKCSLPECLKPCDSSTLNERTAASKLPLSPVVTSTKSLSSTSTGMPRNDGIIYAEPLAQPNLALKSSFSPSVYAFRPVKIASWKSLKDAALLSNHLSRNKMGKQGNGLHETAINNKQNKCLNDVKRVLTDLIEKRQPLKNDEKQSKSNELSSNEEEENQREENAADEDEEEEEETWSMTVAERRAEFESIISSQTEDLESHHRKPPSSNGCQPIRLPGMAPSDNL